MKLFIHSIIFLLLILFAANVQAQRSSNNNCVLIKKGRAINVPHCAGAPETGTITCNTCPSDACQTVSINLPGNAVILEVIPMIKRAGYRGNWDACDPFDGVCGEPQGRNHYFFLDDYTVSNTGAEKIVAWKILNGHSHDNVQARLDVKFVLNSIK